VWGLRPNGHPPQHPKTSAAHFEGFGKNDEPSRSAVPTVEISCRKRQALDVAHRRFDIGIVLRLPKRDQLGADIDADQCKPARCNRR